MAASILSPLVCVRLDDSAELQVLIDLIAPTQSLPGIRRQIGELESFGCARIRGETAAVVPPMFAAGLLQKLIRARPDLPSLLFTRLSHDGRKRLLERLVTVELPEDTPFWNALLQSSTENVSSGELNQQLELLEYLARAAPRVVYRFSNENLIISFGLSKQSVTAKILIVLMQFSASFSMTQIQVQRHSIS